ncbi:MAG: methylmalonyl-CoA mutase, partial [Pseudomonadota bacterium]
SMYYEHLKHSGDLPLVGVNQFINPATLSEDYVPETIELARASQDEKNQQLNNLLDYQKRNGDVATTELEKLKKAALAGENIFEALMNAARVCSLYQMTEALFEVGGQYRRNL